MSDTKRRTDMSSFVDYRLGVKRKLLIVDDGWSGTNSDRSAFKLMIEDV